MEYTAEMIENLTPETVSEWKENLYDINRRFLKLANLENGKYIKKLVDLGFDVNHQNCAGYTPIFYIDAGALEELLKNGADVNVVSKNSRTSLMSRVNKREPEGVKLLLAYGANVNFVDDMGYSALKSACINGNSEIVAILLDAGANIEQLDMRKLTPLLNVASLYKTERERIEVGEVKKVVALLLKKGADINAKSVIGEDAVSLAVSADNIEALEQLVEAGVEVNNRYRLGRSLLDEACRRGNLPIAEILLKAGIDIEQADNLGYTPLLSSAGTLEKEKRYSMLYDVEETVDFLLKNGADVNARSCYGDTAVSLAASWGNVGCLKLLLAAGADVNAVNYGGHTPLMSVCSSGFDKNNSKEEFIRILLDNGADVKHRDDDGDTVLDIIRKCKNEALAQSSLIARMESMMAE